MADEMVLKVQKWLNKTYKNVSGYEMAPENGRTGWPTIYSLREALQYETGSPVIGQGFGETTEKAVANHVGKIRLNYTGNLASLVQGAFWCKGINPGSFNGRITPGTIEAISNLQSYAGLPGDGVMTTPLMKALFDMSAFTLVYGGSNSIREMQQYLNGGFNQYFGILPCDGIYQRDTNTALIYALQSAQGMGVGTANGYYGPGTASKTPTLNVGASGDFVKILQYGLLVNGFYDGPFDGSFTIDVGSAIASFREFMKLDPYVMTADYTVFKGLLTTNGDTNRNSIACDTAKQLTAADVKALKHADFSVVGRYLTGSVGNDFIPKNLTSAEIDRITSEGLSIFPIYQDGSGDDENYFNNAQGISDGYKAQKAAKRLGFPKGTTIYFAVDMDIEDGNIPGTVIPYFTGVAASCKYYKVGIYGTRNVCTRATEAGLVTTCFVSDMSTGYSGNLGFKMPKNWAFDQFVEYNLTATLGIDQVAASGRDKGTSSFEECDITPVSIMEDIVHSSAEWGVFSKINFAIEDSKTIRTPIADYYLKWSDSWGIGDDSGLATVKVKNGKPKIDLNQAPIQLPNIFDTLTAQDTDLYLKVLSLSIEEGSIQYGPVIKDGRIGIKTIIKGEQKDCKDSDIKVSASLEIVFNNAGFPLTSILFTDIETSTH